MSRRGDLFLSALPNKYPILRHQISCRKQLVGSALWGRSRAETEEAGMHRWIRMIQGRKGGRRRGTVFCLADRERSAISNTAGGVRTRVHGPVIAMRVGRPHLPGCRKIETAEWRGVFREFRMAPGLGHRSRDRLGSAGKVAAKQRPRRNDRKQIVKLGGATLAGTADRGPRIYGIVTNAMAFAADESPRRIGCARDLGVIARGADKHLSGHALAIPHGDRPKPVRRHRCALVTQAFTAEFDNAVF
jgi:hypothetical protein